MRWLGVEITSPGGRTLWAPDDPDPRKVPLRLDFSSTLPGGFAEATIRIPRRVYDDLPDIELLSNVRIIDSAGQTAWEGRVHQTPIDSGGPSLEVRCVGWSAALEDNPRANTSLYATQDLGQWVDPPLARRIQIAQNSYKFIGSSRGIDDQGMPRIVFEFQPPWTAPPAPVAEVWFDAGPGETISRVWWSRDHTNMNFGDSNWVIVLNAFAYSSGTWTQLANFDLRTAPASGTWSPPTGTRAISLYQRYNVSSSSPVVYQTRWQLAVWGSHGLPLYGASEPKGVLASDVIRHAVNASGSVLSAGNIAGTDFPIVELDFTEGATLREVIEKVNAFHLWGWAVWENRRVDYLPPDATTVWTVSLEDGAEIALEGDDSEDVINGVIVRYQTIEGQQRTAGPPGSRCDIESGYLADTSSSNIANAAGVARKWAVLDLSRPATDAVAVQLGTVLLRERSVPQRSGSIRVVGDVSLGAAKVPGWLVRAGDWVEVREVPGLRQISQARWSHDSQTLDLQVGAGAGTVEGILARVGARVAEVVSS